MSLAPQPYALTSRDGHTIDQLTNYALFAVERRLKYAPGSLTVLQGSYNGGAGSVPQSAGTHDGGGVVDLTAEHWQDKVKACRQVGFAAWHRPPNWDGRGGIEHIHAVLIGNAKLSPSAAEQVVQYRNHENGLADQAPDLTWHPSPIPVFHMPKFAQGTPRFADTVPVPRRHVFHVKHGQPYHLEDSLRGIQGAIVKRYGWIDLDCHPTKDGHLVITHWPRPMIHDGFVDPKGLLKPSTSVEEMTLEEAKRLRTRRDGYRISEAAKLVEYATTHGIEVELELKSAAITGKQLAALRKSLTHPEAVNVKALPDFYTALRGAHEAGFDTVLLARGKQFPTAAQEFITYRRGPARWV